MFISGELFMIFSIATFDHSYVTVTTKTPLGIHQKMGISGT
jgi:hypothetical protein